MGETWILVPVLFPVVSGAAPWIRSPDQNEMRTIAAVLSLSKAVRSRLIILNCPGMRLPLWNIDSGMELYLRLDGTGALLPGLASLIQVLVVFLVFEYAGHEREEVRFFGCLIISLGVLTRVTYAGSFATLYPFFEMMTFLSTPLVLHFREGGTLRVGMVCLTYSTLGAPIALGGYFFFRWYACRTDFRVGGVLVEVMGMTQDRLQIILLSVFYTAAGFPCKAGLMPLHSWLPIAHSVTPAPASAVLSGPITKTGVVTVIRVVYGMASPTLLRGTRVQHALSSMAVLTISTDSMLAYEERRLKRRLACSSFSQVPYVLFGIFLLSMERPHSPLLQMMFRALAENVLFLCAGAMICKTGCVRIKEMRGMGKRMPAVMLCFTLAFPSLVGILLVGGFLAKRHLAVGAIRTKADLLTWLGSVVLMVSVLLTAGYLFPIIVEGLFPGRDRKKTEKSEAGRPCADASVVSVFIKVPLTVLGISLLALGVLRKLVSELLRDTASAMV